MVQDTEDDSAGTGPGTAADTDGDAGADTDGFPARDRRAGTAAPDTAGPDTAQPDANTPDAAQDADAAIADGFATGAADEPAGAADDGIAASAVGDAGFDAAQGFAAHADFDAGDDAQGNGAGAGPGPGTGMGGNAGGYAAGGGDAGGFATTGRDTRAGAATPRGTGVLHRRLIRRRPKVEEEPEPFPLSFDLPDPDAPMRRIVRLAMSKAVHLACRMSVAVRDPGVTTVSLSELTEKLSPGMLLTVIEGPDDRLGLMAMDAGLLAACLEMLTTGRVAPGEIMPRKPTFTDATLVSPILDQFLQLLEAGLVNMPQADIMGGFRFASFLEDPRPISLMLEDQDYQLISAALEIGEGGRHGQWLCAIPDCPMQMPLFGFDPGESFAPPPAPVADSPRLSQQVMVCETRLDAVLLRRNVTLAEVLDFRPGTVLALPMSALEEITLVSLDRQVVAKGRLGQSKGARAVRITAIPFSADRPQGGTAPPPHDMAHDMARDIGAPPSNLHPANLIAAGDDDDAAY